MTEVDRMHHLECPATDDILYFTRIHYEYIEEYWSLRYWTILLLLQLLFYKTLQDTVRCLYNTVNFLGNPHNRQPIVLPLGRGMGCLLWVQFLINAMPQSLKCHDDVIKWKHFPRYWPFVREIHRSRWIPRTKASDAELRCFLWSAPE